MATPRKKHSFFNESNLTSIFTRACEGKSVYIVCVSLKRAQSLRRRLYAHREWLRVHRGETYIAASRVKISISLDPVMAAWRIVQVTLPCRTDSSFTKKAASATASQT